LVFKFASIKIIEFKITRYLLKKMSSILSMEEIAVLDRQIDQLYDYKPIPENEVKGLCDKVSSTF